MATSQHESLINLTRSQPRVVGDLLRSAVGSDGDRMVPAGTPRVEAADLTPSSPKEYRADQVILFTEDVPHPAPRSAPRSSAAGGDHSTAVDAPDGAATRKVSERPVAAVVLEVQRSTDPEKKLSWPAYVVLARARHRCPTSLVVLAPSREVAAWAARPIPISPTGFALRPLVIGPHNAPYVDDPERVVAEPELAAISTIMHSDDPDRREVVVTALVTGYARLLTTYKQAVATAVTDEEVDLAEAKHAEIAQRLERYIIGVEASVSTETQQLMEKLMPTNPAFKDIFTRHAEAAEVRGEARGEAKSVLKMLESRGIDVPEDIRDTVLSCPDSRTLDTWLIRSATATSAKDLFD